MYKLVLLIKTYRADYDYTKNLLNSIQRHNRENIPVYVSVNDEDYVFYKEKMSCFDISIIKDGDIMDYPNYDGWRYQQIIKSNFYRLNICENYLCIDSDSEFIRDFYFSDFMFDDKTPYTIMHESKGFLEAMENINLDSENIFFKQALRATRPFFGNSGKEWDYGPSPYLWNCAVWKHFNEVFLKEKNLTFVEFFNLIDQVTPPSECVIYGEYLLKTKLIDIHPIEGFFKVYHYKKQYLKENRLNKDQLAKIYLGTIYQSNWRKKYQRKNIFTKWFS